MIEDHLIVVVVVVIERNLKRAGVAFDRPGYERAHDKTCSDKGRVRGGREVVAMTHEWTDIAPV